MTFTFDFLGTQIVRINFRTRLTPATPEPDPEPDTDPIGFA